MVMYYWINILWERTTTTSNNSCVVNLILHIKALSRHNRKSPCKNRYSFKIIYLFSPPGNWRSRKRRRRRGGRKRGSGSENKSCVREKRGGTWREWGDSRKRSRRSCRWRSPWRSEGCCWLSATWNRFGSSLSCWPEPRYDTNTKIPAHLQTHTQTHILPLSIMHQHWGNNLHTGYFITLENSAKLYLVFLNLNFKFLKIHKPDEH